MPPRPIDGAQGNDTVPFFIWCFCIKRSLPTIFVQECTPQFDLNMLREILGSLYTIEARRICPTMLGAGCMRLRQWSVGFLKGKVDIVADGFGSDLFAQLFHREPVLRADDYFVAPAHEWALAVAEVCGKRVVTQLATNGDKPLALEEICSPGALCRLEGYKRMARRGRYAQEAVLAANIVQNPDTRPWLHKRLQTLLRNSSVVLLRSDKLQVGDDHETKSLLMTANEHLCAMGWPLYDDDSGVVSLLTEATLSQLDSEFKKHLAGNGMHIMVAGAVLCFCLAVTKIRIEAPDGSATVLDQGDEVECEQGASLFRQKRRQ